MSIAAWKQIHWVFSLSCCAIQGRYHPPLHSLIKRHGPHKRIVKQRLSLYEFIARTVFAQQLSDKVAQTLWKRLKQLADANAVCLQQLSSAASLLLTVLIEVYSFQAPR